MRRLRIFWSERISFFKNFTVDMNLSTMSPCPTTFDCDIIRLPRRNKAISLYTQRFVVGVMRQPPMRKKKTSTQKAPSKRNHLCARDKNTFFPFLLDKFIVHLNPNERKFPMHFFFPELLSISGQNIVCNIDAAKKAFHWNHEERMCW